MKALMTKLQPLKKLQVPMTKAQIPKKRHEWNAQ